MCRSSAWLAALLVFSSSSLAGTPWQSLGAPLTDREISSWDIDVRPDGQGLPPGKGSVEEGQAIYDAQCASCHGTFGESNDYIALTGGIGTLTTSSPQRTVASKLDYATTLWDYINRAMPFTHSKVLGVNEVYAVTAYVLNLGEILPMDATLDEKSLPLVEMPNRKGYTQAHGFMTADGKPDVQAKACMQDCAAEVTVTSELPAGFTEEMYGDIRTHFRALAGMTTLQATAAKPLAETVRKSPAELAATHGCLTCHGVDQAIVGPAFKAIAERYADTPDAEALLAAKVRAGGSGVWGSAMMPAQTGIPAADLAEVLAWLLAGAHTK